MRVSLTSTFILSIETSKTGFWLNIPTYNMDIPLHGSLEKLPKKIIMNLNWGALCTSCCNLFTLTQYVCERTFMSGRKCVDDIPWRERSFTACAHLLSRYLNIFKWTLSLILQADGGKLKHAKAICVIRFSVTFSFVSNHPIQTGWKLSNLLLARSSINMLLWSPSRSEDKQSKDLFFYTLFCW